MSVETSRRSPSRQLAIPFALASLLIAGFLASARAQDIVAVGDDAGRVYVLPSNGDGTFGALTQIGTTGGGTRGAAVADFDEDGLLDIIAGNGGSNTVSPFFFKQNGDGTFAAPVALPSSPGSNGWFMDATAADLDGDGHVDLVVDSNYTNVGFWWGHGDGTFELETRAFPAYGRGLDVGDFNEDGFLDLVRATYSDGYTRLYLGDGARGFTEAPAIVGDSGWDPYGVAAGDFDEDGHLDVLATEGSGGQVTFFGGNGDGTFSAGVARPELDVNNWSTIDSIDFDRDGHLDVILSGHSNRRIDFFPGAGDGSFGARVAVGNPATNSLGISAPPPPEPDVRIDPLEAVVSLGDPLTLNTVGTDVLDSDTFAWDLGDGSSAATRSVTHTYASEGVFSPSLLHTSASGKKTGRRARITVRGAAPVADPGGPYALDEHAASATTWTATLDGSASSDDFGIAAYAWDFGDGSTGSGATPAHTWASAGPWSVTLTVTDTSGLTHSATTSVTFSPLDPPVAAIAGPDVIDETAAASGVWSASFDATGSSDDVGIWKYEWDFGNGRTTTGFSVSTTYNAVGSYRVALLVYDHAGQKTLAEKTVQVVAGDPPVAVISGPGRLDESVATAGKWASSWDASGSSDDTGIYRYEWDFGDGATASGVSASHEYTALGTYPVRLRVTDNGNQTHEATHLVEVAQNDPPVAGVRADTLVAEGSRPLLLSADASTDDFGLYDYHWALPGHTFGFAGEAIDSTEWRIAGNVHQSGRVIATGSNAWGRTYFFSTQTRVPRGATFDARVDTDSSGGHAMVGLHNLDFSSGHFNRLTYAIYFLNNGRVQIYERGSNRFTLPGSYSRGTSYDVRIVTKPGAGATYFWRPSGSGAAFTRIYDSGSYSDSELTLGADIYSGTFGFDDFRVDRRSMTGRDIVAPFSEGGNVTLTVRDHALQADSTTVATSSVTGAPPEAVLSAPASADAGVDVSLDARASSDDHAIASYEWDFGDTTSASGADAREVIHFWGAPGTYTVTLTVRDWAGQSDTATQEIQVLGEGLVKCVPWRFVGDIEIPHDTWSGNEAVLKASAGHAALPLDYTWDFGDGSPTVGGSATTPQEAYGLEARHVYTASEGTPFEATVTIVDAAGNRASDTYPLILRDKSIEVEVNVAIDDGLWYLHKTQTRTTIDASTRGGYWAQGGYRAGVTASAVQAFEINGHREDGDGSLDPYVETVSRGMNHVMTTLRHVNIAPQTYGDPDTNGNGIGLEVITNRPIYEGGQVLDAIVASGRADLLARAGGTNVKGRPYGDIAQDMIDQYNWGQYDHPTVGGGWRYSWNSHPDNSACQWAAIGSIAAEHVFGSTVPAWVKARNEVWLDYSKSSIGFGYTGPGWGEALNPSGMVQMAWDGLPRSDVRWKNAEDQLARDWPNIIARNNFYAYFAIAKAMRLQSPPVRTFALTGKDWFLDASNGLARVLVDRQRQADGSWLSRSWVNTPPYSSAWAIIILSSSLFQQAPVAVAHVRPNPSAVGQDVLFDATASFHQDPTFHIVEYRWDFDSSDGIDFDAPDAVGPVATHAFGELREFTATLQVKDDNSPPLFDTATVHVAVTIPPHPPTAEAGGPYLAAVGEDVVLDGSGSFDIDEAEGDSIQSWDWEVDFEQPLDFADAVSGERATFTGGFASPGTKNIGLRVTDRTASVFPSAGKPDLTDDDFTQVIVYRKVIDDLRLRPKGTKIQLTWTHRGGATPWHVEVWRSERGPNWGFEKIAVTHSTYATYLDQGLRLNTRYYYRLLVFEHTGAGHEVGDPLGSSSTATTKTSRRSRERDRPPSITSTPVVEATAGAEYRYDVEARDPERRAVTFQLLSAPAGMVIDPASGLVTWTPDDSQVGEQEAAVEAADPRRNTDVQIFQITVRPRPNLAPVAEANGPYAGLRGEAIVFSSAGSSDPDGDPLGFTWSFGDGATSEEPNPVHVYTAAGSFVATVVVSDGRGGTTSDDAPVQIDEPNRPPVAEVAGGPLFRVRQDLALALDGSPSVDLDGDPLTYTWQWGDSTPADSGVSASHVYGAEGTFLGALAVEDGRGGADTYEFTVEVGAPNNPPDALFDVTVLGVNPGDEFTFDGSATSDPDGDPIRMEWDFGDGASTTGIVVTHVFTAAGDFTVRLRATDGFGGEGVATRLVHINGAPSFLSSPPASTLEDQLFEYAVVTDDPDADPVGLTLVSAPAGMTLDGSGLLSWLPGNDDVGDHPISIQASDGLGGVTDQAFTLTVVDVNDPPVITSAAPLGVLEEELYRYPLLATDVDDPALEYVLEAAPLGMTISPAGVIEWTPTGLDVGTHGVTARVSDPRGGVDRQSWTLTVTDVNDPPVITTAPGVSGTENAPYAYDVNAIDEDDPSIVYALTAAPAGMAIDPATGLIQWTPDVSGSFAVSLEARDPRGGVATQSYTLVVANVNDAPVITTSPVTVAVAIQPYAYDAGATDEEGDPITWALLGGPAGLSIDASTGLVTWAPADADVGTHPVTIEARDSHGAATEQSYSIEVRERNHPPAITSLPVEVALEDSAYAYDADATDPDGNPLTWSLDTAPAGMTIEPATGLVSWTPAAADVGDHDVVVRVADDLGEAATQFYVLSVAAVNDAPQIVSVPVLDAEPAFPYAYDADATDEEGDALTWSLDAAPAGMSIDPATGLVTWTPTAGQLGDHAVTARVTDAPGAFATQDFTVTVTDRTHPPVVSAMAGEIVQDGTAFAPIPLDPLVSDPDHADSEIAWSASGGTLLSVSIGADRVATISYAAGTRVTEDLTFTATDPDGLSDSTTASFSVVEPSTDAVAPVAAINLSLDTAPTGSPVTITVPTQDNEGIGRVRVLVDGAPLPVADTGGGVYEATYTPAATGLHHVVVEVVDLAGNSFTDEADVLAVDPTITSGLTVQFSSPPEDATLTGVTDIVGTATGPDFADYRLEYAATGTNDFTEISSATTPVAGGLLGSLDPGILQDGVYTLRLTARNLGGQEATASRVVNVEGSDKVGLYTVSFQDKTLPVGRLPLTVVRTYDNRDRSKGDFGFGWRLALNGAKIVENSDPATNWTQTKSGGFIPSYSIQETRTHTATVILSESVKERFRPQIDPASQRLFPIQFVNRINYAPVGGARGTLVAHQQPFLWNGPSVGPGNFVDDFFDLFNNSGFTYTDDTGFVYRFTERSGGSRRYELRGVTTPGGDTLTLGASGVVRSDGTSIGFVRDAEGRITRLEDPKGNVIQYVYDLRGDLAAVIDEAGNRTEFSYDREHNLLEIRDPLGNRAVRSEYDADGRLIATTDAQGNRTVLSHDLANDREVVQDASGGVTVYAYDSRGNVTSQTDALGNTTTFTYDARGNQLSKTDPLGNTTTSTFDAAGNLTSVTDPTGNTSTFTYDSRGRILTATDAGGNAMTYTYDAHGNMLTSTDPLGNATSFTYDASGNMRTLTNALGSTVTNEHNAGGGIVRQTDLLGNVSTYTYDANGNQTTQSTTRTDETGAPVTVTIGMAYDAKDKLSSTTDPDGNALSFGYNAVSRPTDLTDRNGHRTTREYDSIGNLTRKAFADGTEETYTYDASGNRTSLTNRAGRVTRYDYDALDRAVATHYPDGSVTRVEYDAAGRQVAAVDANGNRTTYEYDGVGRRTRIVDPLGNAAVTTYDSRGNVASVTDANGETTTFTYDANSRRTQTTLPDGSTLSVTYDALGRQTSETDPNGNTTLFEYDAAGHLSKVTDALGGQTLYTYDEVGNRTSVTDANGNTTRWAYDSQRRLTKTTLPLGMTETYTYDSTGNVTSRTDGEGQTTRYEYDAKNRLTRKVYPDASTVAWTYTATSLRASTTDSTGVTTYVYDARNRLTRVVEPDGSMIDYTRDAAGKITSVTTPSGSVLYTYNARNQISTVTDFDGGVTSYTYDAVGNLTRIDNPNGTITRFAYDAVGHLVTLENLHADLSVISSYAYTLDAAGNRARVTEDTGRIVDYTYDAVYHLTREAITEPGGATTATDYTYDGVGNRLSRTDPSGTLNYVYDANNRLVSAGGTTFDYDLSGNLVRSDDGASVTTYEYDFENGLRFIRSGGDVIEYIYDGEGTRVATIVNGVETRSLVDTTNLTTRVLEERDGAGALAARYVWGHGLVSQQRSGVTSYYHTDALGSTRALTDGAGNVTDTYVFDAFGNLAASTGSTANSFLFAGEQYDAASSLYYLRARYYDPSTGRFPTMDPAAGDSKDPMSFNRYLYCNGNPVGCTDPTGMFSMVSVAISIAIVGILASIAATIAITALVFYFLPNPVTAFTTAPDAGLIGGQVSISPTALIMRFGRFHPLTLAISAALVLVSGLGGIDVLIPFSGGGVWIYSYAGVSFGGDPIMIGRRLFGSMTLGAAAFSFAGYLGAVWNVKKAAAYTGHFISVSGSIVNGRFKFLPSLPGLTVFTSPAKGESYGFSIGAGGSTRGASGGIYASWTYYWLEAEITYTDGGLDFGDPRTSTGPIRSLIGLLFGS